MQVESTSQTPQLTSNINSKPTSSKASALSSLFFSIWGGTARALKRMLSTSTFKKIYFNSRNKIIKLINRLSCCKLTRHKPYQSSGDRVERSEEEKRVINQTRDLRVKNDIVAARVEKIQSFVSNDPDLARVFADCLRETKDFLVSLPRKDNSPPNPNELLEALRQELQRAIYLASVKSFIKDFLDNNPAFCRILQEKLEQSSLLI